MSFRKLVTRLFMNLLIMNVVAASATWNGDPREGKYLPISSEDDGFTGIIGTAGALHALGEQDAMVRELKNPRFGAGRTRTVPSNRDIGFEGCDISQIEVAQDTSQYLPDGMPIYHITVVNNCMQCSVEVILIACGDFSSALPLDPAIFRRLQDDDCLLNNGRPIAPMTSVYFEYGNLFPYPMHVKSGKPCYCSKAPQTLFPTLNDNKAPDR